MIVIYKKIHCIESTSLGCTSRWMDRWMHMLMGPCSSHCTASNHQPSVSICSSIGLHCSFCPSALLFTLSALHPHLTMSGCTSTPPSVHGFTLHMSACVSGCPSVPCLLSMCTQRSHQPPWHSCAACQVPGAYHWQCDLTVRGLCALPLHAAFGMVQSSPQNGIYTMPTGSPCTTLCDQSF